jgi:hypothetical protein
MVKESIYLKKIILLILTAVLLFLIFSQIILPVAFEKSFENVFLSELNYPASLKADVKVFPAVKIIFGKIDKINIQAQEIVVDNIKIKKINIEINKFTYKPLEFLKGNFLYSGDKGEIRFTINEKNIEKFLTAQNFLNSREINVEISKDFLTINCFIELLGRKLPLLISGTFDVKEGNLIYKPNSVKLGLFDLGDTIDMRLESRSSFILDFDNFPFNLRITDVFLEKGCIDVKAEIMY